MHESTQAQPFATRQKMQKARAEDSCGGQIAKVFDENDATARRHDARELLEEMLSCRSIADLVCREHDHDEISPSIFDLTDRSTADYGLTRACQRGLCHRGRIVDIDRAAIGSREHLLQRERRLVECRADLNPAL